MVVLCFASVAVCVIPGKTRNGDLVGKAIEQPARDFGAATPARRPKAKRKANALVDWGLGLGVAAIGVAFAVGIFFSHWQAPADAWRTGVVTPWTVDNAAVLGIGAGLAFFVTAWIIVCLTLIASRVITLADRATP